MDKTGVGETTPKSVAHSAFAEVRGLVSAPRQLTTTNHVQLQGDPMPLAFMESTLKSIYLHTDTHVHIPNLK